MILLKKDYKGVEICKELRQSLFVNYTDKKDYRLFMDITKQRCRCGYKNKIKRWGIKYKENFIGNLN